MKTTAKTIALVRLILGEIDMWEQRAQQIDADHTIDETCVSRHAETCPENWRRDSVNWRCMPRHSKPHCDDCYQIDRAGRIIKRLSRAFEKITRRAAFPVLDDQRAQHVCDQALEFSQDALKYDKAIRR